MRVFSSQKIWLKVGKFGRIFSRVAFESIQLVHRSCVMSVPNASSVPSTPYHILHISYLVLIPIFFIRSTSSRLNNSKIKQCTSGNWVLFASTYATPSHFWHFNRCDFWCRFIPLSSSMFYTRFKLCTSRILIRSIFSFKLYVKAKFSTFIINLLPPLRSVA